MPYSQDGSGAWWEGEVGPDGQFRPIRKVPTSQGLPANPIKVQQAQGDIQNTAVTTQGKVLDNTVTAATIPAVVTKAQADAEKAQQGTRFNGLEGAQFSDALNQFNGGLQIKGQLRDLGKAYERGPGATSGLGGLVDLIPNYFNENNQRFDTAANRMRAFSKQGTGTTGGENNSLAEMKLNLGAYIPSSSQFDGTIEDNFKAGDDLATKSIRQAIQRLGGVPDQNGNIFPLGTPEADRLLQGYGIAADGSSPQPWRRGDQQQPNPAAMAGSGGGEPPIFPGNVQGGVRPPNVWMSDGTPMRDVPTQGSVLNAITGNTNTKYQRYPDIEKKVSQAFMAGASLEQLNQILASDPRTAGQFIRPTDYAEAAKARASGRKGDVTFTVGANVPLTRREEFSGSPTASAGAGFANMMSLGGVEALAPQQYADQKALNPNMAFAGELAGSVAGSAGIGALSRQTIGKAFPRLMGGGGRSRVARQVAQDTAYGAGYGGVVNGDPVSGGLLGGAGSLGGQGLGKVVGKSFAGLTKTPFARELEEAGIDSLTVGQNLGGLAARTEDRAMSVPGVGDLIRNRRIDAFEDYNRAEFANAGRPIGFSPPNIRSQGIDELDAAKSAAYSNTLDPVTINVLDDPQLAEDVARAQMQAMRIPNVKPTFPRDYSASSLNNRLIDPVSPEGVLTGRNFQEGYRGLARDARTRANSDYGNEIGEVARSGQNALAGALERQNPGAYSGFLNANTANRNISVLRDAVGRARNGGRTGELEVFAPSQMIDAAAANARKFPGGYNTNLAKAAQRVLPSTVPDSGSAGRLLQYALPTALVGGGVGGYTGGEDGAMTGAGTPLALAALLMAGGSKGGQAALNKLLFSRKSLPARAAKVTGTKIDEQKGLLGSLLGGYLSTKD